MKINDRNFRAYLDLTGVGGPLKDSGMDLERGVVTACRFCPDDLEVLLDTVRKQGFEAGFRAAIHDPAEMVRVSDNLAAAWAAYEERTR